MALELKTRIRWRVCTCGCVIDFDLYRDDTLVAPANYEGASAVPVNIAAQCSAHTAAADATALEALVATENEALARAYGLISKEFLHEMGPEDIIDDGLVEWSMNAAREVLVNVRGADAGLLADLAAVPNLTVTTTMDVFGRETATWVGPDVEHSVGSGQRVIQGSHQGAGDVGNGRNAMISAYFPVLGNGVLHWENLAEFTLEAGNPSYQIARHQVNFPGVVDFFTMKIDGNARDKDVNFRVRVNDVDTEQWIRVPAYRIGVFTCIGDEVAYVAGDSLVGYMYSEATPPGYVTSLGETINIRATHCELQPSSGLFSVFDATEHDYIANDATDPTVVIQKVRPLAGSSQHYWMRRLETDDWIYVGEAEKRFQFLVRAEGTFTDLQVSMQPEWYATSRIQVRNNTETSDGGGDYPNTIATPMIPNWEYVYDVSDAADTCPAISGDKVSILAKGDIADPTRPTGIWKTGINWEGAVGNNLVDHQVIQSDRGASDNTWGNRADKFAFIKNPLGADRIDEWWASPIGEFHPKSAAQVEQMPLGWDDVLIRPSFQLEILYMRAFCDVNVSQNALSVGVGVNTIVGMAYGDLQATVGNTAATWYEDAANREEITANLGFCLRFKASDSDQACIAQITNVMFSYRSASAGAERLCLVRVLPTATEVTPDPCVTHRSRCIKITRTDDEVFAYTEHDEDIVYGGTTYATRGGMTSSASELGSVLGEVGNVEFGGSTRALGITVDDLFGGKFDGATVEVFLIPWGDYQATESVVTLGGGVIGKTTQDANTFTLEALSPSAQIRQKALLQLFTPTCRFALGDSRCQVDLTSLTVSGAVTAVTDEVVQTGATVRRRFYDTTRTEDDGWFDEGLITFVTGDNAGQTSKVKSYATGELVLWEPLIHVIEVGDTYTLTPGCDKKADTCRDKFDNFVNFGGFPTIPGLDATAKTPSGRMGG